MLSDDDIAGGTSGLYSSHSPFSSRELARPPCPFLSQIDVDDGPVIIVYTTVFTLEYEAARGHHGRF